MKSTILRWATPALALSLVLGASTAAWAGAEKNFCAVVNAIDVPGKNKLPDDVATISLAFTGMKAVLSGYFMVDKMRYANSATLKSSAKGAQLIEPLTQVVGALKGFVKAFIPYSKKLGQILGYPDKDWLKMTGGARAMLNNKALYKSNETNFAKFYKAFLYLHDGWYVVAGAVTALRLAALPVCDKVKAWCGKKSDKTCALPVQDSIFGKLAFWSSRRASQIRCAAPDTLDSLNGKHEGTLAKIAAAAGKVSAFIRKWAAPLKSLASGLKKLTPAFDGVKKVLDVFKTAFSPIKWVTDKLDSVLDKKLCVMKGSCFKIKEVVKAVKKYSKKLMKPVMKQVDKIFDKLIKPILDKMPIPGIDKLKGALATVSDAFGKLGDFFDGFEALKGLSFVQYTSDLKGMDAQLASLQ